MKKVACLIFCLLLCSCKDYSAPDGHCIPLKQSKENLFFNVQGGIDSIIVDNAFWWYPYLIECENTRTEYDYICNDDDDDNCKNVIRVKNDYCKDNYCENTNGVIFTNPYSVPIMKIECSWFSITKTNKYTLLVSVNQNETEEKREQYIIIEERDCSSGFSIIQSTD
jgi:hypothetical protein